MKKKIAFGIGRCAACDSDKWKFLFKSTEMRHGIAGEWDVCGCRSCGLMRIFPFPEKLLKYYPEDYTAYYAYKTKDLPNYKKLALKRHYSYSHLKVESSFKDLLKSELYFAYTKLSGNRIIPFRNGLLFDVGAGVGEFLESQGKLGWDVGGIDFSEHACRIAKKHGIDVQFGDYLKANLKKKAAVVNATFILEHLPNPNAFFIKTHAVLEKKSLLVFDVPNAKALDLALFKNNCYALDSPRHLFVYSPRSLLLMLERNGFVVKKILYPANPSHFIKSVNLWLKSKGFKFSFSPTNKIFYFVTIPLSLLHKSSEITVYAEKN
ncbi:MAG: class I SAM-dependent methyltransferase [Candidatus Diapherotrites archaeon]|nr:class I SAM-dependent methyltransferase [Candidatus Diapherotrites archaeon]